MPHIRSDRWVGLVLFAFAVMAIFFWIPLDSETGLIEKVRRRYIIGDALAPTIASVLMGCAALGLLFKPKSGQHDFDVTAAKSLLTFIIVISFSLILMRYSGPIAIGMVDLISSQDLSYRPLRGTFPIRYIGFLCGGTLMIAGLGWFMDGKLTRRTLIRSFLISFGVAACFDLPFEDIILPPNGDV